MLLAKSGENTLLNVQVDFSHEAPLFQSSAYVVFSFFEAQRPLQVPANGFKPVKPAMTDAFARQAARAGIYYIVKLAAG